METLVLPFPDVAASLREFAAQSEKCRRTPKLLPKIGWESFVLMVPICPQQHMIELLIAKPDVPWDWFVVDRPGHGRKLQESGELSFDTKETPNGTEIARMEFLSDVSIRISCMISGTQGVRL